MSYNCVVQGQAGRPDDGKSVWLDCPAWPDTFGCPDCCGRVRRAPENPAPDCCICTACGSHWTCLPMGYSPGGPLPLLRYHVQRARINGKPVSTPDYFRFSYN